MKILKNRYLSILVIFLMVFSSCNTYSLSLWPSFFKPKKVRVESSNFAKNIIIGVSYVGFFVALAAISFFIGKKIGSANNNNEGDDIDAPSEENDIDTPSVEENEFLGAENLNWKDKRVRAEELPKFMKKAGLLKCAKKMNIGGLENNIYQFTSSGQNGAQCGPSAIFNASKLNQYFDVKKSCNECVKLIKTLNDGTTKKQVANLKKNGINVEWLESPEIVEILKNKLIVDLELNKNTFVYPALSFYTNHRGTIRDWAKPLYDLNLKDKRDGFSCSFIVPDFKNEVSTSNGHWICVHVVKTGNIFNWFIICSMNSDILGSSTWMSKIKFMINMLLDESVHDLSFGKNLINEKIKANKDLLEDMQRKINERSTRRGFGELKDELNNMKMLYVLPDCKKKIDLYKTVIDIKLNDILKQEEEIDSLLF